MARLEDRFEAKVDRSGEHHLWTGSVKTDGTGKLTVEGRTVTAPRVAWELANGPVPAGAEILSCPDVKACVRVDHLSLRQRGTAGGGVARPRAPKGTGTKIEVRPGVWKLTVTAGRWGDGTPRRVHRTVSAANPTEAASELAEFTGEVRSAPLPEARSDRDVTVDEAVERFLAEHLVAEKGREESTITHYRSVHRKWFSPEIGTRRLRDVDEATIDRVFGRLRKAGLSASRMNDARSLYVPLFRWAKRRRIVARSPMADLAAPGVTDALTTALRTHLVEANAPQR